MPQESFFARRPFGPPNWLVLALLVCFAVGWVPRGVKQAILTNSNNAADWLPSSYAESKDLLWFRDHFVSAQFVLASWDGCTLGDQEKLGLMAKKLRAAKSEDGQPLFSNVITGPEVLAQLTGDPARLTTHTAIQRLEGALIGPPERDAQGKSLGAESRTTCLIAYLSEYSQDGNLHMREAVDRVELIAEKGCGIDPQTQLHLGGPPVDNITIDKEGEKTLQRLAVLSGLVGISLAYWFFRSIPTTLAVFAVAGISAGASLAVVHYYGFYIEELLFGQPRARYGTVDAILLSMPAVVYVLGLAGAIHLVNYYRDERDERGLAGAAERAVRIGWGPCALAALTTAVGLGSLAFGDIIPIKKFGGFTAAGVLVSIAVLFTILPIFLHVLAPRLRGDGEAKPAGHSGALPHWAQRFRDFVTSHPLRVSGACVLAMAFFAMGLPQIRTSVQLLKLLDQDVKLIHDYAWLEDHLGNLVPMEVVVAMTPDRLRKPDELPDSESGVYRMTMYERMRMIERIQSRVEALPEVSRAMSAATFGPDDSEEAASNGDRPVRRSTFGSGNAEYPMAVALEESREDLQEYMRTELPRDDRQGKPRELWRVSARVAALADIDYGQFVGELRQAVDPVLDAYRMRDQLSKSLKQSGKKLQGAKVCVAFSYDGKQSYDADSPGGLLYDLLRESHVRVRGRGRLSNVNLTTLAADDQPTREAKLKLLAAQDAVVAATSQEAAEFRRLAPGLTVVEPEAAPDSATPTGKAEPMIASTDSLSTVYTGIVPLVYKTQRELLKSLRESIGWATLLIAGVMVLLFRNLGGGLVSMIPNVFPVVLVFGALGWLGIKVDIGIMMTASVALGVAVDDTIHYLTWFRRGVKDGLDRQTAARMAFDRCGVAMTQTTLIAGLGLAVFATSTFTPTQQFGMLMITILSAALIGDLVMLPALLCGPLGWFFAPKVPARPAPTTTPLQPRPEPALVAAETPTWNATEITDPEPAPLDPPSPESPPASPGAEGLSPANAALHAKLKRLRRQG